MSFLDDLRAVVGGAHVLTGEAAVGASVDWTGRFRGRAVALVRPASTAEVAGVIAVCRTAGVAIVPQGGNTGLVGGGVPVDGEVVLGTTRLAGIREVDARVGQITAEAGVTIADLQRAATAAGWAYGVDWAARDSATVGGSIATNAGGVRVIRHGDTRRQLLGVEAVLADGSVISHLGGLEKDNTGYHLAGLLCGSEGTLGVLTAARLRLVPLNPMRTVTLLGTDSVGAAVDGAATARRVLPVLDAAEVMLDDGVDLVCTSLGLAHPFPSRHPAYLLLEAADDHDPTEALGALVAGIPGVEAVAVATTHADRARLWRLREAHTEAVNLVGPPHKLDVTIPIGHLAGFVDDVRAAVAAVAPGAKVWMFGHAADGNLHVNITGVTPDRADVDGAVLELVASLGGSISAEHGIGRAKRTWLHLSRSAAEIRAMRAIKTALDPGGILNPGCLFPLPEPGRGPDVGP